MLVFLESIILRKGKPPVMSCICKGPYLKVGQLSLQNIHACLARRYNFDRPLSQEGTIQFECSQGIGVLLKDSKSTSTWSVGRIGLHDQLLGLKLLGCEKSLEF